MNMKKLFLLNLPYLLFVYPFDKLAQAFRLAPGADLSGKLLSIGDGFTAALSSPWLSFHPTDLLIGITGAVVLRMAFYLKGKNAKKYRHGIEYGSARWGTAADIAPYMDKAYLEMHRPILFNELVLSDKLFEHCAEIEEAARNRMELIVRSLAEQNGVTEQLKAENQMEWVRQMNACKAQAEEVVKAELIYN